MSVTAAREQLSRPGSAHPRISVQSRSNALPLKSSTRGAGMSVRTWSLLGTALALLPVIGFAAWTVVTLLARQQADTDRELSQRSQAVSLAVKRRFDRSAAALGALAVAPAMKAGDFASVYAQAQEVAGQHPDTVGVSMLRRDGSAIFTTAAPWGQELPQSKASKYETRVFDEGATVYTPMYTGGVTHRLVMAVSVPVIVGGKVLYSLRMNIASEGLTAVLREQVLPANWTSAVIDPNGVIAGRSSDEARLVGRPVTPSLYHALELNALCPFKTVTYDGASLLSCAVRVPDTDWAVAIGVPSGTYDRQLHSSLFRLLIAGLASLVIGGLVALKIANAIRAQVKLLTQSTRHPDAGSSSNDMRRPMMREVAAAAKTIDASREREGALETMLIEAKHDGLTGLAGRQLFRELVEFDIERADPSDERIALLFVDLDGFKAVNDEHGHGEGDRLLLEVANAIRGVVRVSDVAARHGGDEFIVYLRGSADEIRNTAAFVAQRLVDQVRASTQLGCSVGVAIGRCDCLSVANLLSRADDLQMQAKRAGKGRFLLHDEG